MTEREKKLKSSSCDVSFFTRADLVVADLGEEGDEYDDIATIFYSSMDIVRIPTDHEQVEYER